MEGRRPSHRKPAVRANKNGSTADLSLKRRIMYHTKTISLLEKCRWGLRGKTGIQRLIKTLRRYNNDLFRLCSWEALSQINQGLPSLTLPQGKYSEELRRMANIAEEAAANRTSPVADGLHQVAELARFKAKIMEPPEIRRGRLLDQADYTIHGSKNSRRAFGESLVDQDPVIIEWQPYATHDGGIPDEQAVEQVHQLAHFLSISDRPAAFRTLECVGIFDDKANNQYGLVFDLPEYLRHFPFGLDNRHKSYPITLTRLLNHVTKVIDLGTRFALAKKLMRTVVALHTCGWLHKGIRPDNILFFPAQPAAGRDGSHKNISRPILVGYGLSRPDDIIPGEETGPPARISRRRDYRKWDPHERAMEQRCFSYTHPEKFENETKRYRHEYDIYSLGLVLLEIGLWLDLKCFERDWTDAYEFRDFVLKDLVPDLWGQCGSIYGGVVRDCLTLESDEGQIAEVSQRTLAWNIAQRLDKCIA